MSGVSLGNQLTVSGGEDSKHDVLCHFSGVQLGVRVESRQNMNPLRLGCSPAGGSSSVWLVIGFSPNMNAKVIV